MKHQDTPSVACERRTGRGCQWECCSQMSCTCMPLSEMNFSIAASRLPCTEYQMYPLQQADSPAYNTKCILGKCNHRNDQATWHCNAKSHNKATAAMTAMNSFWDACTSRQKRKAHDTVNNCSTCSSRQRATQLQKQNADTDSLWNGDEPRVLIQEALVVQLRNRSKSRQRPAEQSGTWTRLAGHVHAGPLMPDTQRCCYMPAVCT